MENEPPEHTRLRRLVAAAFNRGHVERLRPRVRELAARPARRGRPGPASTSSRQYAEPLPVLVIADLLGVPRVATRRSCGTGRRRSCGCTRSAPSPAGGRRPPCAPPTDFAGLRPRAGRRAARRSRATTWSPTWSRPTASADRGRGGRLRRAAAQRRPRGVGQRLRQRRSSRMLRARPLAARGQRRRPDVEEMLRFDSALQLFERTATARRRGRPASTVEPGQKVAALLGCGQPRPGRLRRPRRRSTSTATPTRTSPSASGCTSASGAPLARMELVESLTALLDALARPGAGRRAGEPAGRSCCAASARPVVRR